MYMRDNPDGSVKSVNEEYLVSAINYSQAETAIHKYMNENINVSFSVTDIKKSNIVDVLDHNDYETYWAVKVGWSVTTESGSDKVSNEIAIVLAEDVIMATKRVAFWAVEKVCDFEILEVKKTKIIDFYDTYENAQLKIGESDKAEKYFSSKDNEEKLEDESNDEEKSGSIENVLNQPIEEKENKVLVSTLIQPDDPDTPDDKKVLKVIDEGADKGVFPDVLDKLAVERDSTQQEKTMGAGIRKENIEKIVSNVEQLGQEEKVDPF